MTTLNANATPDLNNDSMPATTQAPFDASYVKDTQEDDASAPSTEPILPSFIKSIDSTLDESAPAEKLTTVETTSISLSPKTEHASSPSDNVDKMSGPPWDGLQAVVDYITSRSQRELSIVAAAVGLIFARYCLRWMNWTTIMVAVLGMGFGGFVVAFHLLAVPEATRLKRASAIAKFGKYHDQQYEIVDGVPEWSKEAEKKAESSTEIQLTEIKDAGHQRVCIAPDIDLMVEEMISYVLRDFVNVPMGLISQGQHNVPLRVSLVAMAMNVSSRLSNMRLPETALLAVFGLQNNFIVHLRAYRELRASKLPIADYVSSYANPDSVLGRCYHKEERLKQFRSTAKAVCQALLSKNDQQSNALFAVMQEIMATHVLESTLEHLCDPDYINLSIIDYFTATTEENKTGRDSVESQNGSSSTPSKPIGTGKHTEEAAISALADSILMNAAHLMDKSAHEKQGPNTSNTNQPTRISISQHTPPSPAPSTTNEVNAFDRMPPVEASKEPLAITLKNVLTNKSDHIDLYQDFMSYLQVWDAMDLVQFWLMIDIFHRQIEQGTLSNLDDLRREASNIFESYCGSDPDENVTGIREAKGGALLKNLKKKIDRDPANCFVEAQEWALNVLEGQYWVPFEIKKDSEGLAKSSSPSSQKQSPSTPRQSSSNTSCLNDQPTSQDTQQTGATVSPTTPTEVISPSAATQLTLADDITAANIATTTMAADQVKMPQPIVQSIYLSDMVNRRPKTLMSNTDLSYMVEVQTQGGQGWMVTRTFQQLEQFQLALVQQFPVVQRVVFPRWRLQPSDKVCTGLSKFLTSVLAIPEVAESEKLAWFLSKGYDQALQESGPGLQRSSTSGLISALSPVADQSAALGAAAAQGAKTAFRQASEASMSAGRFFKSLGAAVGNTNSPQLVADDRSSQGSFESVRSVRSVSSTLTLSEQQQQHQQQQHQQYQQLSHANGVSSSLATFPRSSDSGADMRSRVSSSSESTRVSRHINPSKSEEGLGISSFSPAESGLGITTAKQSFDSTRISSPGEPMQSHPFEYKQSHTMSAPPVSTRPSRAQSMVGSQPTPVVAASMTPTLAPTSESTIAGTIPTIAKKSKVALLSNDELDLLIETSFTVLEDMMDFSKGQSIRRMTFGMLRELVRKSYRVAINESFSAWVESNTSHENAVEMVRWMKDDFFWPNGEWPTPPAPTPAPASTSASPSSTPQSTAALETKKDIIHIGEDLYEIGEDGIAVKVSMMPPTKEAVPAAPSGTAQSPSATEASSTRTLKEKEETREKARELVKMMLPGSLVTVLGREAVLRGLMDVFEMFQIKELNLGLALSVLEMVVRLVLTR